MPQAVAGLVTVSAGTVLFVSEIIDLVDEYIDNNALKWVLMHGENPRMRGEWRFQR